MNGKIVRLNDFKFTYGQETIFVNVYAAFRVGSGGNKYIIYSYDNSKLYYGSLFVREKEVVVMKPKEEDETIIGKFIDEYINQKLSNDFEIIPLNDIDTIQIIDESIFENSVDLVRLYDLAIPKPEVKVEDTVKTKKPIYVSTIFFIIFLLVVVAFFFVNPEVIKGKNYEYICNKSYEHDELPANVEEKVKLIFTSKDVIDSIKITSDYVFTDIDYYQEFKEKGYYYKYFKENKGFKEISENYSYRVFYEIDTKTDYFLPTNRDELISYYEDEDYKCSEVEME